MPEFDFDVTARNIRAWYARGDAARAGRRQPPDLARVLDPPQRLPVSLHSNRPERNSARRGDTEGAAENDARAARYEAAIAALEAQAESGG